MISEAKARRESVAKEEAFNPWKGRVNVGGKMTSGIGRMEVSGDSALTEWMAG